MCGRYASGFCWRRIDFDVWPEIGQREVEWADGRPQLKPYYLAMQNYRRGFLKQTQFSNKPNSLKPRLCASYPIPCPTFYYLT